MKTDSASQQLRNVASSSGRVSRIMERARGALKTSKSLNSLFVERFGLPGYTFLVFVVLPSLITFVYLTLWASDEYVAEARFAVRGSSDNRPSALSEAAVSMLSIVIGGRSTAQDSFMVTDYIRSRTIIEDLGGKKALVDVYSKPDIDWFSRLPSRYSLEDVWEYWRSKVTATIDTQSNVLTLRVRAYTPADAKRLAEQILARSELLVNEISERARRDALAKAETEVQASLQRLAKIRTSMLDFRNTSSVIDPTKNATSLGETITALSRERIALDSNRQSLRGVMDENAPTLRFLATQIESIDRQIANLQARLTSSQQGTNVVSGQIATYEDLQLQSQFAEKLFTISQAAFEKARADQDKQQLYVVTVVRPSLPEEPSYPRPVVGTAIIFSLFLVFWSMISLIVAAIDDHIG